MGHNHIPKNNSEKINIFLKENMDEYINFHRPCGFATTKFDKRGKEIKKYDKYMTPFEKLISIKNVEQYLKPGVTIDSLCEISRKLSDNESAKKMQIARSKLFKSF